MNAMLEKALRVANTSAAAQRGLLAAAGGCQPGRRTRIVEALCALPGLDPGVDSDIGAQLDSPAVRRAWICRAGRTTAELLTALDAHHELAADVAAVRGLERATYTKCAEVGGIAVAVALGANADCEDICWQTAMLTAAYPGDAGMQELLGRVLHVRAAACADLAVNPKLDPMLRTTIVAAGLADADRIGTVAELTLAEHGIPEDKWCGPAWGAWAALATHYDLPARTTLAMLDSLNAQIAAAAGHDGRTEQLCDMRAQLLTLTERRGALLLASQPNCAPMLTHLVNQAMEEHDRELAGVLWANPDCPKDRLSDLLVLVDGGHTLAQARNFDGDAVALLLAGKRLSCTWEDVLDQVNDPEKVLSRAVGLLPGVVTAHYCDGFPWLDSKHMTADILGRLPAAVLRDCRLEHVNALAATMAVQAFGDDGDAWLRWDRLAFDFTGSLADMLTQAQSSEAAALSDLGQPGCTVRRLWAQQVAVRKQCQS